jgi:GNAT superfamily N-acetyltransferase
MRKTAIEGDVKLTIRPLTPSVWPALEDTVRQAFDGDVAVGWCQLTPRGTLPCLDRTWRLRPVDDLPVWAVSCLYVRIGYRRKGVTSVLIEAALKAAKRAKALAVEAYPFDAASRPVMRYDFKG